MMQRVLARKPAPASAAPLRAPSSLRVNKSGDTFEQEADRVADAVISGSRVPSWSFARIGMGAVQRDTPDGSGQQQQQPKPNNYGEAAQKVLEAAMQTDAGKKVIEKVDKDPLVKDAKDFVTSTPGMIVAGTAAAGVVAGLTAAHKPLPVQLPAVPVDKVIPALKGVKAQISVQGPLDRPTQITIGFSGTFGGGGTEKKKKDDTSGQIAKETQALRASMDMVKPKGQAGSDDVGELLRLGKGAATPGFSVEDFGARRFPARLAGTQGAPLAPVQQPADAPLASPADKDPQAKKEDEIPVQRKEDNNAPLLQRECSSGGSGGECDTCKDKREEGMLQRKGCEPVSASAPSSVENVLQTSGSPLDGETRSFFESGFGVDFSKVRIHTDAQAAGSAADVAAKAYTVGNSVVFGSGQYAPHSTAGRRLLAHELTHVVQQGAAGVRSNPTGTHRVVGRAAVSPPALQRQETDAPACERDKEEGHGINFKPPVTSPQHQLWIYGVWGKYDDGDSMISFVTRALTKWVEWRFGILPSTRRAQVKDYLVGQPWIQTGGNPQPGCCYWIGLTQEHYSRARILAGEAPEPVQPVPDETTAPIANALAGSRSGGAKPPEQKEPEKEERGAPVAHDWKVLEGNEALARQYLLWMQHFAGLPKSPHADDLATGGLTEAEINEIIGIDDRYTHFTNLITQGYAEFVKDGGAGLDQFSPLIETVLQQFNWGNPTATRNLLKIGKGDSWVPEERNIVGIAHRASNLLLYDAQGAPLRSVSGEQWRDPGYVGAPQQGWGINIAAIKDPALFGILNMLRQNIGDPMKQAEAAAQVLYNNVDAVKPRVLKGLPKEVVDKFEESLPMFVGFLAGHGLSQFLVMSANPYLIAVGGILKGLLAAAGYVMDVDFAASALDRLLLAARYLSRVTRDDSGAVTQLSEHYMDLAAIPLRDMVADIAMLAGMKALGRLVGAIKGEGEERPKIECHSCTVEPKPGEAKAGETKPGEAKAGESKPAEAEPAEAATPETGARKNFLDTIRQLQELNEQIAQLVEEQKKASTPERGEAIRALRAEVKELGAQRVRVEERIPIEDEQIRKSNLSLFEKIRRATPGGKAAERVLRRAGWLDELSRTNMDKPSVDHIVPVSEIVQMEGFKKLSWESQKAVVDMPENLLAMEQRANSSKGDRSWSEWPQWADFYKDPKIKNDMVAREDVLRSKLQTEIARLLALAK
jgi:hypothetical protein